MRNDSLQSQMHHHSRQQESQLISAAPCDASLLRCSKKTLLLCLCCALNANHTMDVLEHLPYGVVVVFAKVEIIIQNVSE
jgi:hypothetical protein